MYAMKMKYWLILLVFFIGIVPLMSASIMSYNTASVELESAIFTTNTVFANLKSENLRNYFIELNGAARVLARSDSISENILIMLDEERFETIRNEATKKIDRFIYAGLTEFSYEDAYMTDESGIIVYAYGTSKKMIGMDLSNSEAVQSALKGNQRWSDLHYNEAFESNIVVVSTPVYTYSNTVNPTATLNLVITQNQLNNKIHEGIKDIGTSGDSYLVDETGLLLTETMQGDYKENAALKERINTDMMPKLLEAIQQHNSNYKETKLYKGYRGQDVFGVGRVIQLGEEFVGVVIEVDKDEAFSGIQQYRSIFFLTLIGIVFLTFIVTIFISNGISKPLVVIEQYAKIITEHKEIEPLPAKLIARKDEIGRIANAVDIIVKDLLKREHEALEHNVILEDSYLELSERNNEISRLNIELEYLAEHDVLTALPNRRYFINQLELELNASKTGAIALLDLNDFKEINDTQGHIFGDQVLESIGKRLLSLSESNSEILVARYGGDEFLILFKEFKTKLALYKELKNVDAVMQKPYLIEDQILTIEYCMGITFYPDDANQTFRLITNADIAMYQAKKSAYETKLFYDTIMLNDLKVKHQIKEMLENAIENDLFELYYQPQVNLNTGEIDCIEALIRIKENSISPGIFIPLAEESQQIIKIGRWVTEKAIKQIAIWREKGFEPKVVSINFSSKQLEDMGYIEFLKEKLRQYDVDPKYIEIEITESVLIENTTKSMTYLNTLRESGILLALDDFGAGYSSFKYLTYINLSKIKLDREFNEHFLLKAHHETMKDLIVLFHGMGLIVVAEGVEDEETCKRLQLMTCDYIQSYYFSKPLLPEEIERIMHKKFTL